MSLLPAPYPGEVVGSIIIRAIRQTGLPQKRLLKSIWGGMSRSDFGFVLSTGAERLGMLCGMTGDELLERHTLFPYMVAYKSADERQRLRRKCIPVGCREISVAPLVQSINVGTDNLRYCPGCMREDLEAFGESYWHRAWLLPAVQICPVHRSRLMETSIRIRSRRHDRLPHEVTGTPPPNQTPRAVSDAVTRLSMQALTDAVSGSANWLAAYRSVAIAKGYVRLPSRDVASRPFAVELRRFLGPSLLTEAGCLFPEDARDPWPTLLLRGENPRTPFITVKHVLMRVFLELGPPAPARAVFGYQQAGKRPADLRGADERACRTIQGILQKAEGTDKRFGARELLIEAGVDSPYRHHPEHFPKTRALIAAFRKSDQAERQLGRRARWRHLNERAAKARGQDGRPELDEVGP